MLTIFSVQLLVSFLHFSSLDLFLFSPRPDSQKPVYVKTVFIRTEAKQAWDIHRRIFSTAISYFYRFVTLHTIMQTLQIKLFIRGGGGLRRKRTGPLHTNSSTYTEPITSCFSKISPKFKKN